MATQAAGTFPREIKGGGSMPCMICNDQERDLEDIQKIVSDYAGKHPDLFLTASPDFAVEVF